MRAGACAAQQTLSPEAASVLKHSLSLARRRGHVQVTPLHVAATLLSSRASPLRRACLKSQPHQPSHPLHCRALELCFSVALNRLLAAPGPFLYSQPSLSNALIAALKRAQAHQRRGCIEQQQQQQQPLIAIKVELEQLILSILDDPSVSRVMREAGFSSTSVKNNLEDCNSVSSVFQCYNTSGGIYSTPSSPPTETQRGVVNPSSFWHSHLLSYASENNPFLFSPQKKRATNASFMKEDIKVVMEVLVRKKRRNTVIVGDSLSMAETLVAEVMTKVEKGEVPDELRSAKLIKFPFSSLPLMFMSKEEVDMNVADLKRKVESCASGGRVIIYIGDLKWAVEREGGERESSSTAYSPVDHLIAEIGKVVSCYNSLSMRVWLMSTANYQTYIKCQMKQPPLDVLWALQAVSVPSGGLQLSLNATSEKDSRITFSENSSPVSDKKLFSLKEKAVSLTCCPECISNDDSTAQLPCCLKSHCNESLDKENLDQFWSKYIKVCQNLHQGSQNPDNSTPAITNQSYHESSHCYTSSYPYGPNKSTIFSDSETISFAHPIQRPTSLPQFRRQQSCHIEFNFSSKNQLNEPTLDTLKGTEDKGERITLALGSCMYTDAQKCDKIAHMCDLFKENVPWQSEAIPFIVKALKDDEGVDQDKFIVIEGNDTIGKRRLALVIAESMFGSSDLLLCMNMREKESVERENLEMVKRALSDHDKIVVLVEGFEFADPEFVKFLENFEIWGRKKGDLGSAIFILAMDGDISYNAKREDMNSVIQLKLLVNESKHGLEMLNFDHKRKAEWDLVEEVSSIAIKNGKREFKWQVSANRLDLNMEAEDGEGKQNESTCAVALEFLKKIKNRFVFNRSMDQDKEGRNMFLLRMRRAVKVNDFDVEEEVLEEVLKRSGSFLNSSFEEWLKVILQTSLCGVNRKVSFRLCFVGKGESCEKDGFLGTCLPKRILVSFLG